MLPVLASLFLILLGGAKLLEARQCRLMLAESTNSEVPTPSPVTISASPLPLGNVSTQAASSTSSKSTPVATVTPFNYGHDIIRGVNLGGWFVLEPWITPSIFENTNNEDIVDEFTFGQMQDYDVALGVLQNHWDTWITEDDLIAIKSAGLNHVRIPLGFWSVPITSASTNYSTSTSPFIPGAWSYLLRALNWAKTHDLHVIIDLHGAPGSQNGFDNSGQSTGSPAWASDQYNIPRTLDIIRFIAENIGGMIDVLELLNEPIGWRSDIGTAIRPYWQNGYNVVRQADGGGIQVMIGDAFLGVQEWQNFLTYPQAQGVIMDFHEYQVFNYDQIELSLEGHINYSCSVMDTLSSYAESNLLTIIGEWTSAATDCAQWLNGRGVGARWDGTWQSNQPVLGNCSGWTGNMSTFSNDYKTFLRRYWESQVAIGEAIQGWVYWTWKAENADDWSYQRGLEGGWIPQDPTDRLYPNICT